MNNELEFDIKELDLLMLKVSKVHEKKHHELIEINDIYSKLKDSIINKNNEEARYYMNKIKTLSNNFELPNDYCQE